MRIEKWLTYATLALAATACSLRSYDSGSTTVSIAIPGHQNSSRIDDFVPTPMATASPAPGQLSDFDCYAVNISGAGIPPAPGTSCPSSAPGQYIGIYGGMYSAGPQTVSFQVPNGSGISIQLMGFDQAACQSLSSIFNGTGYGTGGSPYLLASTTVDISQDTEVDLTASFNASSAQQMFQNCAVGSEATAIPATRAFQGYIAGSMSGVPELTLVSDAAPSGLVTSTTLNAVAPLSVSSLPKTCSNCGNQAPVVPGMLSASSTSTGSRAAMQLMWDLTANHIPTTGYGNFTLDFRGGQADNCATSQAYGASAGVWDQAQARWISLGSGLYQSGNIPGDSIIQWFSGSSPIAAPLSDLAVTGSDGDQYVVVQIESNFGATASGNTCSSAVYLAAAGFAPAPGIAGEINDSNTLQLSSNGIAANVTGNGVMAGAGQTLLFSARGGVPPYTYSTDTVTGSTIDANGVYTGPPSASADLVTVTDSAGNTASLNVSVAQGSSPSGLLLTLDPASMSSLVGPAPDGSYSVMAGSCLGLDAYAVSYAGFTSFSGIDFTSVTLMSPQPGAQITNYMSGCTTAAGTQSVTSSELATGLYVEPTQAGFFQIQANASPSNGVNAGAVIHVTAAPYYGVAMIVPALITTGECIPVTLRVADEYGNANPTGAPTSVTVNDVDSSIGGSMMGMLFNDAACGSPINDENITVSLGQNAQYYFKDTNGSSHVVNATTTVGSPPVSVDEGGGGTISGGTFFAPATSGILAYQVGPPSQAVAISLALIAGETTVDSNGCLGLTIGTVDSAGTLQPPSGATISINLQMPAGSQWYSSQANCDSLSSGTTGSITLSSSPWSEQIWVSGANNAPWIGATQGSGTPTPTLLPAQLTVPPQVAAAQ